MHSRLQYISQGTTVQEQIENIRSALDAGCNWIQLRFKQADDKTFETTAISVKKICDPYNAVLILNDKPGIVKTIDAHGVHLGLEDMAVTEARKILGPEKIIGGTANTLQDVLQRVSESCDYIGLGPFRYTSTKEKLSPILGAEGYKTIMETLAQKNIHVPVYAIGGITDADTDTIIETGVYGIAVSGIITNHPNKKELVELLNSSLHANA